MTIFRWVGSYQSPNTMDEITFEETFRGRFTIDEILDKLTELGTIRTNCFSRLRAKLGICRESWSIPIEDTKSHYVFIAQKDPLDNTLKFKLGIADEEIVMGTGESYFSFRGYVHKDD